MDITDNFPKETENKYQPSRVLFVRNLPIDATEGDLSRIFSQFGPILKVLLLINKANAFIEFDSLEPA